LLQGPSLLKNFGGSDLIVYLSMTSPCSLNRGTTFYKIAEIGGTLWNWHLATPIVVVYQLVVYTSIQWCYI